VNDEISAKQRYERIVSQSRARRQPSALEPDSREHFVFTSSVINRRLKDEQAAKSLENKMPEKFMRMRNKNN